MKQRTFEEHLDSWMFIMQHIKLCMYGRCVDKKEEHLGSCMFIMQHIKFCMYGRCVDKKEDRWRMSHLMPAIDVTACEFVSINCSVNHQLQ